MRLIAVIILCFISPFLFGQTDTLSLQETNTVRSIPSVNNGADSTVTLNDSTALVSDTLKADTLQQQQIILPVKPKTWSEDTLLLRILSVKGLPDLQAASLFRISEERADQGNELLFYLIIGISFLMGFIKSVFPKYFNDLFRLFFQTSFRQKQTREQLAQNQLASLFFNLFFFITAGLFVALALSQKALLSADFWTVLSWSVGCFTVVYTLKFLFIKFAGLIFHANEIASTYLFIVFLINKILGILLVPLLFFLAYGNKPTVEVVLVTAVAITVLMLVYRYVISLSTLLKDMRISPLHFFIYLCGVEIAPLLVIGKVLFNQMAFSI